MRLLRWLFGIGYMKSSWIERQRRDEYGRVEFEGICWKWPKP